MLLCMGNLCKLLKQNNKAMAHYEDYIGIWERLLAPFKSNLIDGSFIVQLLDLPDELVLQCSGMIDCYNALLSLLKYVESDTSSEISCLKRMGDVYLDIQNWNEVYERYVHVYIMIQCFTELFSLVLKINMINSYEAAIQLKRGNISELQYKVGIACIRRSEFSMSQKYLNAVMGSKSDRNNLTFLSLYALGISHHHLEEYQTVIVSFSECLRQLKNDPTIFLYEGHIQYWIGKSFYEMSNFTKGTVAFLAALRLYSDHRSKVKDQIIHNSLHLL